MYVNDEWYLPTCATTLTDTCGDLQNDLRKAGTVFIGGCAGFILRRHNYRLRRGIVVVRLLIGDGERRILLFRNAHVVARIALLHDVPGARIQQDGVLVKLRQLGGSNTHQSHSVPVENNRPIRRDLR